MDDKVFSFSRGGIDFELYQEASIKLFDYFEMGQTSCVVSVPTRKKDFENIVAFRCLEGWSDWPHVALPANNMRRLSPDDARIYAFQILAAAYEAERYDFDE